MTQRKDSAAAAVAPAPEADFALQQAKLAVQAIWDKKGFEVVLLRVREIVHYTDYMVIASATSDRHAIAIGDNVEQVLFEKLRQKPFGSEGRAQGRWVLIDYGDFVVHVFHRPVRDYYEIERLYADAPRIELEEPAWLRETSPDALVEQAFDYGDELWRTAGPDADLDDEGAAGVQADDAWSDEDWADDAESDDESDEESNEDSGASDDDSDADAEDDRPTRA